MGETISEIMSEEFGEEHREKYGELMEDLYEILIEFMGALRRRAVSDKARPFCLCCSRATCLTVSLSIWQSYAATVPISATLVTWSYYILRFLLPARLASHQLESQLPQCDLSAD